MAQVFPFHGYRYNQKQVEDLEKVVTQPYDKIDNEMQKKYYEQSPYNIVRLILGKEENRYQSAAENLEKWIKEQILIQDQEAGFYLYTQEYEVDGEKFVRRGFVGLGELEAGEGVKAHENTMEGPKADRLNLIRATEANFGHIFMLYSDQKNEINSLLAQVMKKEALFEVRDEDQNLHKIWQIKDSEIIKEVQKKMKSKNLYIADGHHRYQTALNYQHECKEKGWEADGVESFNHRLMTFVNMDDPGLKVLPTHRLVYGIEDFELNSFLEKVGEDFRIKEFKQKEEMYDYLDQNQDKKVFGFKAEAAEKYYIFEFSNKEVLAEVEGDFSKEYKELDVSILHNILLDKYLGIDKEALAAKSNLDYIRYRDQALEKLKTGKYQAAFILNPTSVKEVKEIADQGEKMPQKSTDFYPKLLTGLVINKLSIKK
ncbi:uncharacterized protein (DUF1015 family) [Halanaerobium saccharolyticum]|uniref:Uncharacterized protein (DUF1015 family) n=1 Tax=Halanaerobium saccharolyticum TaxID=43595 RepID=A0A4R6LDZ6_9FIRM|nr:DUF1015 domain-containing protein [Halanaerobium saccharolyticum]TDO77641.1 uncharacterized protein (DUF1015 family) [Halanaerobium saccharolyticum]